MVPARCIHCGLSVVPISTDSGTEWTHRDGNPQCPPTYASPDLGGQP